MKLLYSHRNFHHFILLDRDNVGYIAIVDEDHGKLELMLGHTVCCWSGSPSKEIAQAVAESKGTLSKIMICSREGDGYRGEFGADLCFKNVSGSVAEEIETFLTASFPEMRELLEAEKRKQAREKEVRQLIREFRYGDAKVHCEIYELDYAALQKEMTGK